MAARLFAEQGYAATSVDQIVAGAGVSKPALYRFFESKKDLYLSLLRRFREELADAALSELGGDRALDIALESMIDAWFAYVEIHPFVRMLFRDDAGDPDIEAVLAEVHRAQRNADIILLRTADPPLPDAELEPLGEVMRSSLAGLAIWWREHPGTPRSALVGAMVRVARGVLASPL